MGRCGRLARRHMGPAMSPNGRQLSAPARAKAATFSQEEAHRVARRLEGLDGGRCDLGDAVGALGDVGHGPGDAHGKGDEGGRRGCGSAGEWSGQSWTNSVDWGRRRKQGGRQEAGAGSGAARPALDGRGLVGDANVGDLLEDVLGLELLGEGPLERRARLRLHGGCGQRADESNRGVSTRVCVWPGNSASAECEEWGRGMLPRRRARRGRRRTRRGRGAATRASRRR